MLQKLLSIGAYTLVASFVIAGRADGQPIGTFTWQLQPYCNVLTLNVTQTGSVYTLDGYDDQCGAATRASAAGLAFLNPDGTIGMGVAIVVSPGAAPLHVSAAITLPSVSGTWRDSSGNTGTLAFNPGPASGSPRPPPATVPASHFIFQPDGGFAALSTFGTGSSPVQGAGTRLLWHPRRAALRAGRISGSQWDDANVGPYSIAFGQDTTANGSNSTAMGFNTTASGFTSTALGSYTNASGIYSTATGHNTTASGAHSTAMGVNSIASGDQSTAIGFNTTATGSQSTAMGYQTIASGDRSTAMGSNAFTSGHQGAFIYGDASTNVPVTASAANQFTVRAAGGVRFFSTSDTVPPAAGVQLAPGASAWTILSDANSKHLFRDLDGETVLSKLAAMPIREWGYKAQDSAIRHVGPTAQDFHAAFGLGEDPLGISTIDADGIALRAIQALEARTRREREALAVENAALRAELAALRKAITALLGVEP
jgi:hypothetical protein